MNKVIRLLFVMLIVPMIASAQFEFANVFPADSSSVNSHGLVVDAAGNLWNAPYFSSLIDDGATRVKPVFIYDENGDQLDFSPIYGTVTGDSLLRFGPITGVNKGADGNIYIASHGFRMTAATEGAVVGGVWRSTTAFIHVINPETGEGVEVIEVNYVRLPATATAPVAAHAPNRPAVTEDGYVVLSFVFPASPIVILDPSDNWSVLQTVTSDKLGFSRTLEVSADGTMIFNPNSEPFEEGGAAGHVQVLKADDIFSEYEVATPLAVGTPSGAIARVPGTNLVFFSGAGVGNDPNAAAPYISSRYYGYSLTTNSIVSTFDWNYGSETNPYKIPRALAFSDDGQTAYAGSFSNAPGAIQKFGLAGEINENALTVTFRVNTATVSDTLRAGDKVLMRGAFRQGADGSYAEGNFYGQDVNWGTSTLSMNNVGGDYWELGVTMAPGDGINFKYYPLFADGSNTNSFDDGWEAGDPRNFVVPSDATENIVLDLAYWNHTPPFESKEDSVALFFRVNVGSQVATGAFNPETDVIGLRGEPVFDWGTTNLILDAEPVRENSRNVFYSGAIYVPEEMSGTPFKFKYVFGAADNINTGSIAWDDGNDAFNPDGDGNNQSVIAQSDSTYAFKFFQGRRPPTAEVVDASLQFAVNVGVLEELNMFNRAFGDRVYIPGGFNGWDTNPDNPSASFNEALGVWTQAFSIREEVGATVQYKYFVRWDASRFDDESPNYVEFLDANNGWEEPGITGGGNRVYAFTDETTQTVDDFGSGQAFFNGVPPQGVIKETINLEETLAVKFMVDMTPALSHTVAFNPALDSLFLILHTPIFAVTQELPTGQAILDEMSTKMRVMFTPVDGQPNMFELTLDLALPTENHIGFTLAYVNPEGEVTENGTGFDAGRRYYRYITPLDAADPDNIIWPDTYELAAIEWKATNLDWETPPSYGVGTSVDRTDLDSPNAYVLHNNYPNPFNPTTNISFSLPASEFVELSVYNVLGQKVATVLSQQMTAGTHSVSFNARALASGVYIYQIRAGSFVQNKTMMLVK